MVKKQKTLDEIRKEVIGDLDPNIKITSSVPLKKFLEMEQQFQKELNSNKIKNLKCLATKENGHICNRKAVINIKIFDSINSTWFKVPVCEGHRPFNT